MGNLVVTNDAPATIAGAPQLARDPFDGFGRVVAEFGRNEASPDVDVYDTVEIVSNKDVYVAIFPSFILFSETFEAGNVTIEVLDSAGNPYNYTELPLSSSAKALALISYRTVPAHSKYYYRVTPGSGLEYGEYALIDTAEFDSGAIGRRLQAPEFQHKPRTVSSERLLQTTLDGETFPAAFQFYDAYTGVLTTRYEDLSIGGASFSSVDDLFRLGFVSGGSAIDFSVTWTGPESHVRRYFIDESGDIVDSTNLTLTDGRVDFQFATADARVNMMVLKFDSESLVQIEARHAGDDSNTATMACLRRPNCRDTSVVIPTSLASELVAVQVSLTGFGSTPIPVVDTNTSSAYGGFTSSPTCVSGFLDGGVFFAKTSATGTVEVNVDPPTQIFPSCAPDLKMKFEPVELTQYLGIKQDLLSFEHVAQSSCDTDSCATGILEFTGVNGLATTSNLTMLVHGFSGSTLALSIENTEFYNESFPTSCPTDPTVLTSLTLPPLNNTHDTLSIQYAIEGSALCSDTQKFVTGVLGYSTVSTPNQKSLNGDDTALIAGLSSAAVLLVLGALMFAIFKPFRIVGNGSQDVAVDSKEEA